MNNKRLEAIFKVFDQSLVIDVGSDHGYLPLELLKSNRAENAIIIEVNEGPLNNAKKNTIKYGFNEKVELILSDGLNKLNEEKIENAGIVVAGMGGKLISQIIKNDVEKFRKAKLFLQPNNNEPELRKFLISNNFKIEEEILVKDEGIIYEVIVAVDGNQQLSNEEVMFGINLVNSPLFVEKWREQKNYLEALIKNIKANGHTNIKLEEQYKLICHKLGEKNEII